MTQAVFNLEYRAYPAATLQWYIGSGPVEERFPLSDGPDYSGVTTKTLTILDVTEFMDGTYYSCKLTNAEGSVWSRLCLLTVNSSISPPVFVIQPDSQEVVLGGEASLVALASGTEPITYQWYLNDILIDGATEITYTINPITEADLGNYYCIATNVGGSTQSDTAILSLAATLWSRSFGYTLDGEDLLDTVIETDVSSFYPFVNKRMILDSGPLVVTFTYELTFGGGSDGWNLYRGAAIGNYSSFYQSDSFNQIMNSQIAAFAGWQTGEFGWTYFAYGPPEAIENPYTENGIWGNPFHGTTTFSISALKLNGMRDITVHVIGYNAINDVLFDSETTFEDRITGSDIMVMAAGASDTFFNDGSFEGTFTYL